MKPKGRVTKPSMIQDDIRPNNLSAFPESTTYVGIRGLEEILATNRVLSEQIWLLMFEADAETGALRRIPP